MRISEYLSCGDIPNRDKMAASTDWISIEADFSFFHYITNLLCLLSCQLKALLAHTGKSVASFSSSQPAICSLTCHLIASYHLQQPH
jgi:hypothetical protein